MEKTVQLKDRSEVVIRAFVDQDLDAAVEFFRSLPREDREYLRRDVSRREIVETLLNEVRAGGAERLVAVAGDRIVAEGALEREGHSWKQHVGEFRIVVARDFQRRGLGMWMARELYHLAVASRIEELVVKMMRPQKGARKIFRRLGFHEEIVLPEYVRDLDGNPQDLIVMRCDLEGLWQELEDYFDRWDWQRAR